MASVGYAPVSSVGQSRQLEWWLTLETWSVIIGRNLSGEYNERRKIVWEKDGSEMVLIPSGSFEMGDHFDEGNDDELPIHEVELNAFYMDAYQVTVGQFKSYTAQVFSFLQ